MPASLAPIRWDDARPATQFRASFRRGCGRGRRGRRPYKSCGLL